ncbi:MAG TPA: PKD domain-containing protein [Armatimonadota bacterium]|nr:PKD domain-containing protein [Armatimonadota bacterium]
MACSRLELHRAVATAALAALLCWTGAGCELSASGNDEPQARAGADQTVAAGAQVTLDGSASTDADGDALTYAWTQTGGPGVALTGANTAQATFSAPAGSAVLTFLLTVDDGHGGTDSDTVTITVEAATTSRLYVANLIGNSVVGFVDPGLLDGNVAPDAVLSGTATELANPADVVVIGEALAVANFGADSITVYSNAETAHGNEAPRSIVAGANSQLVDPTSLAVDAARDLLYVADVTGADRIMRYAGASLPAFGGDVAPASVITSADLSNPFGVCLAGDELYVANNATNRVAVYARPWTLAGEVAATRVIRCSSFSGIYDVFVDSSDRMYVVGSVADRVSILEDASTLNGLVTPTAELTVPGAGTLTSVVVASDGTGYLVDRSLNRVYAYSSLATRDGTVAPDRTIEGGSTLLNGPVRAYLDE